MSKTAFQPQVFLVMIDYTKRVYRIQRAIQLGRFKWKGHAASVRNTRNIYVGS
jgi:hypothetical protein